MRFWTVLALMFVVRTTFANQYLVPTGSMEPTIAVGDRIFTNRVAYDLKLPFSHLALARLGEPARGDVVVFESPREPGLVLVKRLIALPGDHLVIENGFVSLNGRRLDGFDGKETLGEHSYLPRHLPERTNRGFYDFTVPPDHYFFMGDNRDNSADGRYFGFVPRSLLIGRASRVLFSLDLSQPVVRLERVGKRLD